MHSFSYNITCYFLIRAKQMCINRLTRIQFSDQFLPTSLFNFMRFRFARNPLMLHQCPQASKVWLFFVLFYVESAKLLVRSTSLALFIFPREHEKPVRLPSRTFLGRGLVKLSIARGSSSPFPAQYASTRWLATYAQTRCTHQTHAERTFMCTRDIKALWGLNVMRLASNGSFEDEKSCKFKLGEQFKICARFLA